VEGDELLELGARADDAHLAAQDVPELGQLVEPGLAEEVADRGDPRVPRAGEREAGHFELHRAELEHRERLAPAADAAGPVEDRSGGVEKHRDRDQQPRREGERKDEEEDDQIECPLPR
jgi:hypothetical protein